VTQRKTEPPELTQKRERFFERERRDFEIWPRLTRKQRRQPYWRQRELQRQSAGKVGLIIMLAGDDLPEPLARVVAAQQSSCYAEPPADPLWGSPDPVSSLVSGGLFAHMRER
jgi:hypothetical protein